MKSSSIEKIKLIRSWITPNTALYKSFNRVVNAISVGAPEDEGNERKPFLSFRATCADDEDMIPPAFTPTEKSLGAFSEQRVFCLQQIQWHGGPGYGPRVRDILPLIDIVQQMHLTAIYRGSETSVLDSLYKELVIPENPIDHPLTYILTLLSNTMLVAVKMSSMYRHDVNVQAIRPRFAINNSECTDTFQFLTEMLRIYQDPNFSNTDRKVMIEAGMSLTHDIDVFVDALNIKNRPEHPLSVIYNLLSNPWLVWGYPEVLVRANYFSTTMVRINVNDLDHAPTVDWFSSLNLKPNPETNLVHVPESVRKPDTDKQTDATPKTTNGRRGRGKKADKADK